jgi:hypothetical protein
VEVEEAIDTAKLPHDSVIMPWSSECVVSRNWPSEESHGFQPRAA